MAINDKQINYALNGGDWRSKSLALMLMVSTTVDGFYFANCVLADAVITNFNNNKKQKYNVKSNHI